MLTDILEHIKITSAILSERILETDMERKANAYNSCSYIEENGRMLGLQESINEINILHKEVDKIIKNHFEKSIENDDVNNLGLLFNENETLRKRLQLATKKLNKYEKLEKQNKIVDN